MEIDITTLRDLSIFSDGYNQSVFDTLNYTHTDGGKVYLKWIYVHPLNSIENIMDVQKGLQHILANEKNWTNSITNGTIMVMEKFFETTIERIPKYPNAITSLKYQWLHSSDYGLIKYSLVHFVQFVQEFKKLAVVLLTNSASKTLNNICSQVTTLLSEAQTEQVLNFNIDHSLTAIKILRVTHFIQHHFKNKIKTLIELYYQLDAYYSMAMATKKNCFSFPSWLHAHQPIFKAEALYHPLLKKPVAYNIDLEDPKPFLFLTGANMTGKSTFIKAMGIIVFLAHLGMGVPAKAATLSLFDGVLSNIQVTDNIINGESYFFSEVQRIKNTIVKISNQKSWLILIDELFKGTNIQDAFQCSSTVINGLLKSSRSLFILSTHLYEIANDLEQKEHIQFKFFETQIKNNEFSFTYALKEGISNDRLGFLILKKEGVVELLEKLN